MINTEFKMSDAHIKFFEKNTEYLKAVISMSLNAAAKEFHKEVPKRTRKEWDIPKEHPLQYKIKRASNLDNLNVEYVLRGSRVSLGKLNPDPKNPMTGKTNHNVSVLLRGQRRNVIDYLEDKSSRPFVSNMGKRGYGIYQRVTGKYYHKNGKKRQAVRKLVTELPAPLMSIHEKTDIIDSSLLRANQVYFKTFYEEMDAILGKMGAK